MYSNNNLWDFTLNMALASYLSKTPNRQVKDMARRYRKQVEDPTSKQTLKLIAKSLEPSTLVRLTYADLIS